MAEASAALRLLNTETAFAGVDGPVWTLKERLMAPVGGCSVWSRLEAAAGAAALKSTSETLPTCEKADSAVQKAPCAASVQEERGICPSVICAETETSVTTMATSEAATPEPIEVDSAVDKAVVFIDDSPDKSNENTMLVCVSVTDGVGVCGGCSVPGVRGLAAGGGWSNDAGLGGSGEAVGAGERGGAGSCGG